MTFPDFQGRGHATAIIAALAEHRRRAARRSRTPCRRRMRSNTALRRNGFVYAGEVEDPEDGLVWRWEKGPGG